jgi:hypothetical protein
MLFTSLECLLNTYEEIIAAYHSAQAELSRPLKCIELGLECVANESEGERLASKVCLFSARSERHVHNKRRLSNHSHNTNWAAFVLSPQLLRSTSLHPQPSLYYADDSLQHQLNAVTFSHARHHAFALRSGHCIPEPS